MHKIIIFYKISYQNIVFKKIFKGDSWVDVKGSKYKILDNKGSLSLQDGFQVTLKFFVTFCVKA